MVKIKKIIYLVFIFLLVPVIVGSYSLRDGFGRVEIPNLIIIPENPSIYVNEEIEFSVEFYETEYSCEPGQLVGDINNDGKIDVLDVIILISMIKGEIEIPGNTCCIDTNNDGLINEDDIDYLVDSFFEINQPLYCQETSFTWSIVSGNEYCSLNENIVTGLEAGTCVIRVDDNNSPAFAETNVYVLDSFQVTVNGYIMDQFSEEFVENALITIVDGQESKETYSDEDGYFSIEVDSSGYLFTTIEKEDYVKRHTWATVDDSTIVNDIVEINYSIVPRGEFYWGLYNSTMRTSSGIGMELPSGYRDTTRSWAAPPNMYFFNDTTYVGGSNIDVQFSNLVYNAQNILPTFNPRDAFPENVIVFQEINGFILGDNEKAAYFDNSILGAGLVIRIWSGPRMSKCLTAYKSYVGLIGPDNAIFNQELGSCFGAAIEPPFRPSLYSTVFSNPTDTMTYSEDDYKMAKIYLDRNKIHYRNVSSENMDYFDRLDWEARPDIVEQHYNEDLINNKLSGNEVFEKTIYGYDGRILKKQSWNLSELPSEVMEKYPILFSKEQIEQRKFEEK